MSEMERKFDDGSPVWTQDELDFHNIHVAHIAPDCTICDYEFSKDHFADMGGY